MFKKKKAERLTPPGFQIYYKARIDKTVWYQRKDRHTDIHQQNQTETPETDPQLNDQLIFNNAGKGNSVEKKKSF